jgi:hypothetical protein
VRLSGADGTLSVNLRQAKLQPKNSRECVAASCSLETSSTTTQSAILLRTLSSAFVTAHSHDAGPPKPYALGALQSRYPTVCDRLFAVRRDDQEPTYQRRHQGAFPGLHGKARHVSSYALLGDNMGVKTDQVPRTAGD